MKWLRNILIVAVASAISVWLFMDENAAQPGALTLAHAESAFCEDCHVPWKGVSDDMCIGCHEFWDASTLKPSIRFHEAERHCLECHTEHRAGDISKMDHTLLNGELLCSQCHLDPHEGLFGEECRECHGIETWRIQTFNHPSEQVSYCNRCHRPPFSHRDPDIWALMQKQHEQAMGVQLDSPKECWRCHVVHDWRHLRMTHQLAPVKTNSADTSG